MSNKNIRVDIPEQIIITARKLLRENTPVTNHSFISGSNAVIMIVSLLEEVLNGKTEKDTNASN